MPLCWRVFDWGNRSEVLVKYPIPCDNMSLLTSPIHCINAMHCGPLSSPPHEMITPACLATNDVSSADLFMP